MSTNFWKKKRKGRNRSCARYPNHLQVVGESGPRQKPEPDRLIPFEADSDSHLEGNHLRRVDVPGDCVSEELHASPRIK